MQKVAIRQPNESGHYIDPNRKILRTKEIGQSGHLRVTGKMAKTCENSVQKCGGMVF